jgi:hypothetical protein
MHWNSIIDNNNVYLSIPYLTALEKALQGVIDFRYTLFYNEQLRPVAVSYLQIMHFADNGSKLGDTFCHIRGKLKNKLLGVVDARVLTCGNVFGSGENGFAFLEEIKPADAFKMLAQSMKRLALEKEQNGRISIGLVKDFWPQSTAKADHLIDSSFKGFYIDVNMVLRVLPEWKNIEDYLHSMTTKFRTKAKGVYKKSATLQVKNLNLEQIIQHQESIEQLYLAVLEKAEFKFGELNGLAFVNFKKHLKDKFVFKAYFLNNQIVGFSTLFLCGKIGDANYVGLNYEQNKMHAVYQRMLYDLVEEAIKNGLSELRLGRTAETLKSSIGAEPVNMKLYARHRNAFTNKLIGPLLSSISPSAYELRPPFKKEMN